VLWRVLLAVLGFFGGIGILIYLAVWLITPAEGDSASPVEGLLGRGRSSTSPLLVIILGMLVALVFGLIVTDAFRAALLGAAILIGGALLVNRNSESRGQAAWPATAAPGAAPVPPAAPASAAAGYYPAATHSASAYPPAGTPVGEPAPAVATSPPPGPYPPPPAMPTYPAFPVGPPTAAARQPGDAPPIGLPVPPGPPPGGYRPAFAPHGPYAGGGPPPGAFPPAPPVPPPPKPPRERSGLGAATFSLVFVALGVVAALDLSNAARVGPSAYFAGALITVALGLLVGAWFGRARWLIALGLALTAALGISAAAESWDRVGNVGTDVVWTPESPDELANRYENNFGDAVLDLSAVDFTGQDRQITVEVNFGTVEVVLPPEVDVTATVEVGAGEARVLGNSWSGVNRPSTAVTDLGADGAGGGQLDLTVRVNAGDAEVRR
jgi:hypothetical protein